ncbi:MAG TPA: 50S ribosomal protein L23 [Candidatus Paceibacterota bacterium]
MAKTTHHKRPSAILRPRITEKASSLSAKNAYTFEVASVANKKEIREAIKILYNVTPIKITTIKIPQKKIWFKKGPGVSGGGKKAVVHLKEGDKINFV